MHVALVSLERWDDVWRRNQHLASRLTVRGDVDHLTFIEPPTLSATAHLTAPPDRETKITVVRPRLPFPKRLGGLLAAGRMVAHQVGKVDVLWINDPSFGVHLLHNCRGAVYDVTDDWRSFDFAPRIRRRLIRAEDRLAQLATTVVCSRHLADSWKSRYGIVPELVKNGVDPTGYEDIEPLFLPGTPPHIGYIGTLHAARLDLGLVLDLASSATVGTVHLVGPDALDAQSRAALAAHPGVYLHGPVHSTQVPRWMTAMDVLVSPHRVDSFTLSLDAIKSYEYLSSGRPVVATPTSGFQEMNHVALAVAQRHKFVADVERALTHPVVYQAGVRPEWSWDSRAQEFAAVLRSAARS